MQSLTCGSDSNSVKLGQNHDQFDITHHVLVINCIYKMFNTLSRI